MLAVAGAIIFGLVVLMTFGLVHLYTLNRRIRQLTVRLDLLTAAQDATALGDSALGPTGQQPGAPRSLPDMTGTGPD